MVIKTDEVAIRQAGLVQKLVSVIVTINHLGRFFGLVKFFCIENDHSPGCTELLDFSGPSLVAMSDIICTSLS